MTGHLDAARWAALQTKPDPALLAHLAEGCDVCDEFLAAMPGPDGEVDRLLLSLAPRAASTDELAWARLRRYQRRPLMRGLLGLAAVAVLGIAAVALSRPAVEAPYSGLKGGSHGTLELRAALKSTRGLTPVVDGAAVPSGAALVFQVRSSVAGPARLFLQRGDAQPVELTQLGLVQGAQELENGDDGLLGFSLAGERGPLSVWLVAAEAPMSVETALEAIRAGGDDGVVVAKVRVDVTP
jgi:hypothetical protein